MSRDLRYALRKPCEECPWSRTVRPRTLGGQPVTTFIGQAYGPFWLPCHRHTDYSDPAWATDLSKPQCAGAAMFRDLVGVADELPAGLHRLEGDPALVFASPAEFVAHHEGVTVADAEELFAVIPVGAFVLAEVHRATPVRR